MPIYEFSCLDCGEEFEELILGSDPEVVCSKCASTSVKRLLSAVSFKTSGSFTPAAGSSGCSTCSATNCSSCK